MDRILYQASPSMFRNRPVTFALLSLALLAALAAAFLTTWRIIALLAALAVLVAFGLWWLSCRYTRLIIRADATRLQKGILSRRTSDIFHRDVRNVRVAQNPVQRLFRVGYLAVASAGQGHIEIEVDGIPDPDRAKEIINECRRNPA